MLRYSFWLLIVLAIGLAAWAAWLAFVPKADEAVFAMGQTDSDCGKTPVGPRDVVVRLTNQSDQPARVLGFPPG